MEGTPDELKMFMLVGRKTLAAMMTKEVFELPRRGSEGEAGREI